MNSPPPTFNTPGGDFGRQFSAGGGSRFGGGGFFRFSPKQWIVIGVMAALLLLIILLVYFLSPRDPCVSYRDITFNEASDPVVLDFELEFHVENPNWVKLWVTELRLEISAIASLVPEITIIRASDDPTVTALNQEKSFDPRSSSTLYVRVKIDSNNNEGINNINDLRSDAEFTTLRFDGHLRCEYLSTHTNSPIVFTLPIPDVVG